MKRYISFVFILVISVITVSCGKDHDSDPVPVDPAPAGCDTSTVPVIMVHGMLASGDTYARHAMRLEQNGYCYQRIFAFDWNSVGSNQSAAITKLDQFVDSVKSVTGSPKVNLIGHSAGAGLVYGYCNDADRVLKVNKLVYIGAGVQSGPAGPNGEIPTLNLYSTGDKVATGADIPGAVNVQLTQEDHYEVATSKNSFIALYEFLESKTPQFPDIIEASGSQVRLSGRALVLGENTPVTVGTVEIYELDILSGNRISATPNATFVVSDNGAWGPFLGNKNAVYEYRVKGSQPTDRAIHYFREKAARSNQFIYLRTIPVSFPLALFFSGLPSNGNPVLGVFTSSQAVVKNRDNLTVDGTLLSQTNYYNDTRTTIASFLFDGNNNQTTDLTDAGLFNAQQVFLAGIDMFFPQITTPLILELNGRLLHIRRIESSVGVTVPVFD
jgi:pimeloyl-ACP methyl ester carboxylesterase